MNLEEHLIFYNNLIKILKEMFDFEVTVKLVEESE